MMGVVTRESRRGLKFLHALHSYIPDFLKSCGYSPENTYTEESRLPNQQRLFVTLKDSFM